MAYRVRTVARCYNNCLCVTAIVTMLGLLNPAVLSALRRDPQALAAGQWWRILSPILVHPQNWAQIVVNFVGIAVVGTQMERLLGGARWLPLYFIGGLVGNVAGYLWNPFDAGASVAVCGLVGALLAMLSWRVPNVFGVPTIFGIALILSLAGAALAGSVLSGALAAITGGVLFSVYQRHMDMTRLAPIIGIVGVIGALVLTLLSDNHGPAFLAGVVVGAVLLWLDPRLRTGQAAQFLQSTR